MAKQPIDTPGMQTMELTPVEQQAIKRMRMSPAERTAERQARRQAWLDAMDPEVRQAVEDREARVTAMTASERRVYLAGRHLAGLVRLLRHEVQHGLSLADAFAAIDHFSQADMDWFVEEVKKVG